jgi:hypothetical protein
MSSFYFIKITYPEDIIAKPRIIMILDYYIILKDMKLGMIQLELTIIKYK